MRESQIVCDTLLIIDAGYKVKRKVPKLLLECSMRQLHNELIVSPDDGGLLGDRDSDTNDVIIVFMKDKADNSRGSQKDELIQSYK